MSATKIPTQDRGATGEPPATEGSGTPGPSVLLRAGVDIPIVVNMKTQEYVSLRKILMRAGRINGGVGFMLVD